MQESSAGCQAQRIEQNIRDCFQPVVNIIFIKLFILLLLAMVAGLELDKIILVAFFCISPKKGIRSQKQDQGFFDKNMGVLRCVLGGTYKVYIKYIYYTRSRGLLRPFGLLDNVLHALRALRPCDPRNSAMKG